MKTTRPPRRAPPPPREQITSVYGVIYFTDFSTFGTKLNGCVRESVGGGWRCHEREHRRSLPPPPTRCLLRPPALAHRARSAPLDKDAPVALKNHDKLEMGSTVLVVKLVQAAAGSGEGGAEGR